MKSFIRYVLCIFLSFLLSYKFFHSEPLAIGIILAILLNIPIISKGENREMEIKCQWILLAMAVGGIIILFGELIKMEIITISGIIVLTLASALLVGIVVQKALLKLKTNRE